jgi:hypothetical protein
MPMKMSNNPTTLQYRNSLKNRPVDLNPKSKNEIGLGIGSAAGLLYSLVSYISSLYSITNCSVGNKLSNVLGRCGLL